MEPIQFKITHPESITTETALFVASRVPQFSGGCSIGALTVMAPEAPVNGWNARAMLIQHPEDEGLAPVNARQAWVGQLAAKPFGYGWFGDRQTAHFDTAEQAVAAVLELAAAQSMADWTRSEGLRRLGYDATATEVEVEAIRPVHDGPRFCGYQTRKPEQRSTVPVGTIDWTRIPAVQLGRGAHSIAVVVRGPL